MTTEHLELSGDEDQPTVADWERAAAGVLRKMRRLADDAPDSDVWQKLTRTTLDGIAVPPIGTAETAAEVPDPGEPGAAPFTRGRLPVRPEGGWDVRCHLSGLAAGPLNEAALLDLENGGTSLWLAVADPLRPDDLAAALDGVFIDLAPVVLDAADPLAAARSLVAVADERGVGLHPDTNFGSDPVGAGLRADGVAGPPDQLRDLVDLARTAGVRALVVDGTALHDLGASDAQEIGYTLAVGAAYLRALVDLGLDVDEALGQLEFRYAVSDEQFPSIAKLRAARRGWARIAELSGGSATAAGQRQHAVTSRPMMSRYDPYVNMLRTTVAAFAAGVGGADAITVLPFDSPLGVPESLGRRNARNTSSLLIAESHVAAVADPAGGSYAVERLTHDLAHAGWDELTRIEEAGGAEAALADGSIRARVDAVVAERDDAIAHRTRPLTGVSEFPQLQEELPTREADPAARPARRYAAPFEELRDAPARQSVFLATLGPIAAHTARATFATNLFAAGGVRVEPAGATDGVADVLAAYDGQPVACLAGADSTYAEWGGDLVAALRKAGVRHVVLAGTPGEGTVAVDRVDDACAVGVDALQFLRTTREKLA